MRSDVDMLGYHMDTAIGSIVSGDQRVALIDLVCSQMWRRRFDGRSRLDCRVDLGQVHFGGFAGRISGESNVWSGLQRMWWPDQDFVNPASPVLLSESPSGRSAVPRTVLRLLTNDLFSWCRFRHQAQVAIS
ncbi:hypothetical protein F2Q69_00018662 [Brassica cretica]|uniref:Uncharacterized protein n=1 Tax=Brassica cretica TaxID=69181 RepID=A0A8S9QID8_BRACR|nr:hypothetical protein F2Q69_00018662 [Brassica cretica]